MGRILSKASCRNRGEIETSLHSRPRHEEDGNRTPKGARELFIQRMPHSISLDPLALDKLVSFAVQKFFGLEKPLSVKRAVVPYSHFCWIVEDAKHPLFIKAAGNEVENMLLKQWSGD